MNPVPSGEAGARAEASTPPRVALVICHALLAGAFALWLFRGERQALWVPILFALTSLGLVRRVAWGRFLFSAVSLLLALCIFAWFCGSPMDLGPGERPPFDLLLGFTPPIWLTVLAIVVGTALVLMPATLIGWRKHWFRSDWW
jgi:hypothetical protein